MAEEPPKEGKLGPPISRAPAPISTLRGSGYYHGTNESANPGAPQSTEIAGRTLREELERAHARSEANKPPPPSTPHNMPSHEGMPEGWRWLLVAILWGIFAFSFGFEAVTNFGEWWLGRGAQYAGLAALDAALCVVLGVTGLILWKGRSILPPRFVKTLVDASTNAFVWIGVLLVALIVLGLPSAMDRFSVARSGAESSQIVFQETGCFGGPCPKYEGSPLAWAWNFYNIDIQLPPATIDGPPHITGFHIYGKNVGTDSVQLKSAYMESRIDGTRMPLSVIENKETIPLAETNPVPPGASFILGAQLYTQNPLSESEFFQKWRSIAVVIEYGDQKVSRTYSQSDLQTSIDAVAPGSGPHVTRRAQ